MYSMICPVCRQPLKRLETGYRCERNHCFDCSAQGYVNLLTCTQKHTKIPGDSKEMVAARERFLGAGYYDFLLEAVAACAVEYLTGVDDPVVVDAGCGEGYYTCGIAESLQAAGQKLYLFGFDISKFALKSAAKKKKEITWAVASIFAMPLEDRMAHLAINIFAPLAEGEFARVIRPGGWLITVTPGADHLFEMKKVLYEKPYQNDVEPIRIDKFEIVKRTVIQQKITVQGNGDLQALFQMTPYCWRTPRGAKERLDSLPGLTMAAEFIITVYRRL